MKFKYDGKSRPVIKLIRNVGLKFLVKKKKRN